MSGNPIRSNEAHIAMLGLLVEIGDERTRQVTGEGWMAEHDDAYRPGDLALAAAAYAAAAAGRARCVIDDETNSLDYLWPWDMAFFKPKDPRRDLVRAAALLVAEIERLDRAEARSKATAPKPDMDAQARQSLGRA